jgi:mRNA interferase MazF
VLVVASDGYWATATSLAIVIPVSTRDLGWPNHILLRGHHLASTGRASR